MINPVAVTELYSRHSRRSKILFYTTRVVDGGSFLSVGPEVHKRFSHVGSTSVVVVPVPKSNELSKILPQKLREVLTLAFGTRY